MSSAGAAAEYSPGGPRGLPADFQFGKLMPMQRSLVDIHCHVLPGIDDGAPDIDEAIAMARSAADSGVATLVATPHARPDFPAVLVEELAGRCERLRAAIAQEGIELAIVPGAEVSLSWALDATDQQLRLASFAQHGTDLLVETPTAASGSNLGQLIYEVRRRGYRVTLAHPERHPAFHRDRAPLAELADHGVLLQVNADAVVGPRRSQAAHLARQLCVEGLVSAVASDGHRAAGRRPIDVLGQARAALEQLLGAAAAVWLTELAPAAIVAGEPLPEAPPSPAAKQPLLRLPRRR